ncbi:DUF6049 family protein [Arsenicicoccus cauae]|uniref:DUF6049 family protein n=1 Tax=Arsenicicoccus cauae TaxID=2663847 RepID=UPI00370D32B6
MTRRSVRAAAAVAASIVLVGMPTAAAAIPHRPPATVPEARPSAQASGLTVRLDELAPAVVRPDQDVTVRVTVSSTSTQASGPLSARVLLGGAPFTQRQALSSWLHATQPRSLATREVATQSLAAGVPAKGSTTATMTIARSALRRGTPFGSYPLAVEVRSGSERVALARSVLPWVSGSQEYEPLRLAWIAPLTLPARRELFAGDVREVGAAWSQTIGDGGVLRQRLDAAVGTPVTWMVDPAVLTPPTGAGGLVTSASATPTPAPTPTNTTSTSPSTTTRAGVVTPSPAGTPPPGSASPSPPASSPAGQTPPPAPGAASDPLGAAKAAADALAGRLKALGDDQPVWSLPAGDPDTAALVRATPDPGLSSVVWPAGSDPLSTVLGRTVTDSIAWPADGSWAEGRTTAWTRTTGGSSPTAAVVSTEAVASPQRKTTPGAAQRSADGTPLLAYDEGLSEVTAGNESSSDTEVVQEFLGQSLTLLGELPGTRRTALVAVPRGTTLSGPALRRLWGATASAPWLRQVDVSSILGQGPQVRQGSQVTSSTTPTRPPSPLDGTTVDELESDLATVEGLRRILPADAPTTRTWTAAIKQLTSSRWRGGSQTWSQLRDAVGGSIDAAAHGVQVRPSTINFLADSGTIQITVDNTLPYAVHDVRLELVPGSPKLRVTQSTKSLTIAAGSRTTIQVEVTALGAGTVPLEARLSTPDGIALGSATTVDMNVRPTSVWVFALVAGIVGLILVLGLARSLRRGPTRAQRELGDHEAVADAVLGTGGSDPSRSTDKDPR